MVMQSFLPFQLNCSDWSHIQSLQLAKSAGPNVLPGSFTKDEEPLLCLTEVLSANKYSLV